jgi:hypothetical protein
MRAGAGDDGEVRGGRRAAWDAVARAREGSREGEQGRGRGRTTCGVHPSRRWRGGGGRAAARAKDCRQQERNRAEHVLGEEERGGGPGDVFVKTKNFRDPTVKKDFPLI